MSQKDFLENIQPEQIDLDATTDAKVIGNLKTQDFLVIMVVSMLVLLLFSILGFLPFLLRIWLFAIPFAVGFFFQADGPRKFAIKKDFNSRPREISPGEQIDAAYEWKNFETAKNFITVDDTVIVFGSLVLPPIALLSQRDLDGLTEGFSSMVRTSAQAGALIETYLFHRAFVPNSVDNIIREKYWMETGTSRYVTELYIRLIFAGKDVVPAETISNRIRRAYFSNGGKGEWIWASAAVAAQESHDALNPGALRKRYLEVVGNASSGSY